MNSDQSATLAWLYVLLLCGEKEIPIDLVIRRRFFVKGSASCVHVGYVDGEDGERKSVAMVTREPQQNSYSFLFKGRVTRFKEPFAFLLFDTEDDVRAFLLILCLQLHSRTQETEFEGCIIDHALMAVYKPGNKKSIVASVFVLSRFAQ